MGKSEFLKKAINKYKEAIKSEWISEMNFIYSPKLLLRVFYNPNATREEISEGNYYSFKWSTVSTIE